jgi:hypothetical protein
VTVVELRVDWFRLLADLKRLGWSHYAIEHATRIPRESLRDWANRISEPRHHAGEKLIAFWCLHMDRPRESVPLFDPFDPAA